MATIYRVATGATVTTPKRRTRRRPGITQKPPRGSTSPVTKNPRLKKRITDTISTLPVHSIPPGRIDPIRPRPVRRRTRPNRRPRQPTMGPTTNPQDKLKELTRRMKANRARVRQLVER